MADSIARWDEAGAGTPDPRDGGRATTARPFRTPARGTRKAGCPFAARRARRVMGLGCNLGSAADTNIRAALAVLKFAGMESAMRSATELPGGNGGPIVVECVVFGRE